jgi:hypothetical protein
MRSVGVLVGIVLVGLGSAVCNAVSGADDITFGTSATGGATATGTSSSGMVDAASPVLDITFDDPTVSYVTVSYVLTPFQGEAAAIVIDPTMASNSVARIIKHPTDMPSTGTTVSTMTAPPKSIPTLPITTTRTTGSVKVYLPATDMPVRIKVEDATDGTHSVETQVNATGVANTWQTVSFDFSMPAIGTQPLNPAYIYDRISVFVDFNVTESVDQVFYFDDLTFY